MSHLIQNKTIQSTFVYIGMRHFFIIIPRGLQCVGTWKKRFFHQSSRSVVGNTQVWKPLKFGISIDFTLSLPPPIISGNSSIYPSICPFIPPFIPLSIPPVIQKYNTHFHEFLLTVGTTWDEWTFRCSIHLEITADRSPPLLVTKVCEKGVDMTDCHESGFYIWLELSDIKS